ncbi:MAG: hypothetical protein NXI31_22075 [bacterium]|nr:hypothetical protein [bacterium]
MFFQESQPIIESGYRFGSDSDAAIAAAVVVAAVVLAHLCADRTPRWRSKRRRLFGDGKSEIRG